MGSVQRRGLLALAALTPFGAVVARARASGGPDYIRTAHPGEPDSLDPQAGIAAPAMVVANELFEGLYTLDARGRPVLGSAEAVRETSDPAGPGLEFQLRAGLQWSDGTALGAADFEYAFKRLATPGIAGSLLASHVSLLRGGAAALAGRASPDRVEVRALDPRRLRIGLVRRVAWLPAVLAFPAFAPVPRHVIEKHGRSWARPGTHVGNGPFRVAEWKPNTYVHLTRNLRFRDAASVRLAGVRFLPVTDQNAAFRLFQDGQIDALTNFPPEKLDLIRSQLARELHIAPSLGITGYLFNFRRPLFRDRRVRRALALAIDRELLTTRIVRSGDRPAYGLVPAGLPNYPAPLGPAMRTQAERVAESRRLLAAAGYGPSRPLEFELLYHTSEEHKKVAVAAAAMWQSIGIRARLRNAERQVVDVATRNGDFDVARAALFGPYPDPNSLFHFFRAGSSANGADYRNPAFEAAVEAAEREFEPGPRRAEAQRRAERILIDDQAFLPLYFMVSRRLVAQRVRGWNDDNLTALRSARYLSLAQ